MASSKATKTVALSERAYKLLDAKKREGESFTDVVERLAGDRPLLDMADTGTANDDYERAVNDAGKSLDRSTERRVRELAEGDNDAAPVGDRQS